MKKILFPFLLCGSVVGILTLTESCYYDKESELYPTTTTTCDTTNAKFTAFVSPLISSSCASSSCHSTTRQAGGINLGTYTAIKNYITTQKAKFVGSIKHSPGFSQMPDGGAKLSNCEVTKIETWINAGMQNN